MDEVDRELSRIAKASHRDFPTVNWNDERRSGFGGIEPYEIDAYLTSSYFVDRPGESDVHGDTLLHRILSTHAPAKAIQDFLYVLQRHYDFVEGGGRATFGSTIAASMADKFKSMPAPPSLQQQNQKGVTALHVAIHRNSWHVEHIVRMLMDMEDPRTQCDGKRLASIAMTGGSYPLHVLCGHNTTIQKDVLKLLLQADPTVVRKEDKNGDNPFSLLWKNVLRFRWAISMEQGQRNIDYVNGGMAWMTVIAPEQYLLYSLLMIKALRSCSGRLLPRYRSHGFTMHELCAVPRCPPLLLRLALSTKYRSTFDISGGASSLDELGRLPIHYAVQMPTVNDRFVPPYFDRSGGLQSIVEILLEEYPESVTVEDNQGRLPLHYAVECGFVDERSIHTMIRLYPESLRIQDPITGLYPFMLVAAESRGVASNCSQDETVSEEPLYAPMEWKEDHIRMTYAMLQSCPEVVQFQQQLPSW